MKKVILAIMAIASTAANAEVILEHASLNSGGYVKNISVVPQDLSVATGKYKLSYSIYKMAYNHEFLAAKHVIDLLPMKEQGKVYAFWHAANIENKLDPKGVPDGQVRISDILKKSTVNTTGLRTLDDYDAFMRKYYTEKTNQIISVTASKKIGEFVPFTIVNNTGFNISKIYGKVYLVDTNTNQHLAEYDLNKNILVPSKKSDIFNLKFDLTDPDQIDAQGRASAYKFVVTGVDFSNAASFYPDNYYYEIKRLGGVFALPKE